MIEFLKPNKSKLKLSLLILMLFIIAYIFQAIVQGYLNERSSKEFDNIMASPKYSELKPLSEKMTEVKPVMGNELSSLHIKYLIFDLTSLVLFTALMSYLGACFIHRKWYLLSS